MIIWSYAYVYLYVIKFRFLVSKRQKYNCEFYTMTSGNFCCRKTKSTRSIISIYSSIYSKVYDFWVKNYIFKYYKENILSGRLATVELIRSAERMGLIVKRTWIGQNCCVSSNWPWSATRSMHVIPKYVRASHWRGWQAGRRVSFI